MATLTFGFENLLCDQGPQFHSHKKWSPLESIGFESRHRRIFFFRKMFTTYSQNMNLTSRLSIASHKLSHLWVESDDFLRIAKNFLEFRNFIAIERLPLVLILSCQYTGFVKCIK